MASPPTPRAPRWPSSPAPADELVEVLRLLHLADVPFVARGAGTGLSGGALAGSDAVLVIADPVEPDPAARSREPAGGRRAGRRQRATLRGGAAPRPPLRARPLEPDRLHAGRQRRGERRRAALPQVRGHHQPRRRARGRAARRPAGATRLAAAASRGDRTWSGSSSAARGCSASRCEITLRLEPIPAAVRTLLADFTSLRAASEAVSAIIAAGIVPAALEMMDQACVRAVEASIYATGYPDRRRGGAAGRGRRLAGVGRGGGGGRRGAPAASRRAEVRQRRRPRRNGPGSGRAGRRRSAPWGGSRPTSWCRTRSCRGRALPDILDQIAAIAARRPASPISNVFHAGDGNLHPNISFDRRDPALAARVHAASRDIMHACLAAGGSITGEHGVGTDKLEYMPEAFDAETLDAMCDVRGSSIPTAGPIRAR